ncbi:MAG: OB-fold nucleic acid binding domain-containing protein [Candidatus Asgardarchaeia archaeon]
MSISLEEIIRKIMEKTSLSREEIMEKIKSIKEELGAKFISDVGAAQIIASDLGVPLFESIPREMVLEIRELKEGQQKVSVIGRVMRILGVRDFKTDKASGKVGSFILADQSGEVRVVLWNENAELISGNGIKVGDIVKVSNGYTRRNIRGNLEVHVGTYGKVIVNPPDVNEDYYPEVISDFRKISELGDGIYMTSLEGILKRKIGESEFSKSDGTTGKRLSAIFADDTGEIKAVFWNEAAEFLEPIPEGKPMILKNVRVKKGLNDKIEIHVDSDKSITPIDEEQMSFDMESVIREEFQKISELEDGMLDVNVRGRVSYRPERTTYERGVGESIEMLSLTLSDESGSIRCTSWDKKTIERLSEVKEGDVVVIRHGYTRMGPNGLEVRIGRGSVVEINPEGVSLPSLELLSKREVSEWNYKKIREVSEGSMAFLRGTIVYFYEKPLVYTACPHCMSRVERVGDIWNCPNCGVVENPKNRLMISVTIDDGTSNIRASFIGDSAEKLTGMTADEVVRRMREGEYVENIQKEIKEKILGLEIGVFGKVQKNEVFGGLEIMVNDLREIDPKRVAWDIINRLKGEEDG